MDSALNVLYKLQKKQMTTKNSSWFRSTHILQHTLTLNPSHPGLTLKVHLHYHVQVAHNPKGSPPPTRNKHRKVWVRTTNAHPRI